MPFPLIVILSRFVNSIHCRRPEPHDPEPVGAIILPSNCKILYNGSKFYQVVEKIIALIFLLQFYGSLDSVELRRLILNILFMEIWEFNCVLRICDLPERQCRVDRQDRRKRSVWQGTLTRMERLWLTPSLCKLLPMLLQMPVIAFYQIDQLLIEQ